MAKKSVVARTESDGSEKLLVEMIERFSTKRAIDWLRVKFPSFDTGRAEAIACDATKNEKKWIRFGVGFKEGPKEKVWYEGERLLLRRLMSRAHRLMTGYTDEAFVTNKNLYILRQKQDVELKVLLAIANSRLYSHLYASRVSGSVKDDFPQVTMTDFLSLPLPETTTAERRQFIALVDQVLASKAKDREADTSPLEAKIDQLVYKLYGLTEEEIAVVEGAGEKKPTAPKSERPRRAPVPTAAVVADEDDEELE